MSEPNTTECKHGMPTFLCRKCIAESQVSTDKEAFLEEFADLYVREWTAECATHGIEYVDHSNSATRMLARVIGRTLHEWDKRTRAIGLK